LGWWPDSIQVDHEAFVDGGFVANTPIMKASCCARADWSCIDSWLRLSNHGKMNFTTLGGTLNDMMHEAWEHGLVDQLVIVAISSTEEPFHIFDP